MKKLVSLLVSAALVMGLAAGTGIFASAEEIDLTPDLRIISIPIVRAVLSRTIPPSAKTGKTN